MATLGMPDAEHKWAYSAIVDMLNDRDRALADEPSFICGFTGLSKRKWKVVRSYLLEQGYLVLDDDGDLTNPRFERERAAREEKHSRDVENGRAGGLKSAALRAQQGEFELADDELSPKKQAQESLENAAKTQDKSGIIAPGSNEISDLGQPPPQPTRARKRLEAKSLTQSIESHSADVVGAAQSGNGGDKSLADPPSVEQITARCCEIAGFAPQSPEARADAVARMRSWLKAGISLEGTIVPTIRAVIAQSDDPTSSLTRFDRRIRHEHARAGARPKPTPTAPTPEPVLEPEGEDARFRPLRADLLKALGGHAFSWFLNDAIIRPHTGNKLEIRGRNARNLLDADRRALLLPIFRKHGFDDVTL